MARPSKAQLKERKRQQRLERKAERAVTYDPADPQWVVCDKCGFVQPMNKDGGCQRGKVLSGPGEKGRFIDLTCDSIYAHTLESYQEEAA